MNTPDNSRFTRMNHQHTSEDLNSDGLDGLIKLLALVKNEGPVAAFEDGILYGGQRSVNDKRYLDPLHTFRRSLDDATLCMEALVGIKSRLAKKIRGLKRRIDPLVLEQGITKMPDDVLAHIFESGHRMSDDSRFALRMSRVCRRFRRISLRMPILWTRISSQHPVDQTKAFLSRSANQDLQINIIVWGPHIPVKVKSFLKLVGPHSDRWSRLLYFTVPGVRDVVKEFKVTSFPRLRYIFHQCFIQPSTFHYKWKMPLLEQFDGNCSEFPKGASFPFLSQLTRMVLSFSSYNTFDISSLAQALYRAKNLQHLSLEFINCGDDEALPQPPLNLPSAHAPHIESLKVILKDSMADEFVRSLHQCLAQFTASFVELSLLTNSGPYDFLMDEDSFAFPRGSTVQLQMRNPYSLPKVLNNLLKDCEIIRSIVFEMSAFKDDAVLTLNAKCYPSLQHIRFHNCIMFEEKHVEMLARAFLSDNGNDNFHSLEIVSCSKISEDFILNLQDEVGERLKWSV